MTEWKPGKTKDLVVFEDEVIVGVAFCNLIRIAPAFVAEKVLALYKDKMVQLQDNNYLLK